MKQNKCFYVTSIAIALLWSSSAFSWDPVRDLTGRTLKQHVEKNAKKTTNSAKKLARDPVGYLMKLPEKIIADVCSAPVRIYEGTLRGQADGKWESLPSILIEAVQPAYSVDLSTVRFAEGINTANGAAQTFGRWIYFPHRINLKNYSDLRWMLHELEHVVQYAGASYGYGGSLCEYIFKSVGSGFDHDKIDWERAADRKANWVIDYAFQVMNQGIPQGMSRGDTLARNQILIFNETNYDVFFMMETAYTAAGEERIPARGWTVFTGDPRDTWFNVRIGTRLNNGGMAWRTYGLNGATRQHIAPDAYGALDFLYE
ncbi:MAG: DUF4157 domain-containing protein [Colwellia sp.]|nr:DUF4157 domain-containing protein [Colwellia sp.]